MPPLSKSALVDEIVGLVMSRIGSQAGSSSGGGTSSHDPVTLSSDLLDWLSQDGQNLGEVSLAANMVLATPDGIAGVPTFRVLVADDLPAGLVGWALGGNAGTDPASDFIGTTDDQDLVLRAHNVAQLRILATGMVQAGNIYLNNNENELALPPYGVIGGYAIEGYEVGVFPEGWIRFATGVDPTMTIDSGDNNYLVVRSDGEISLMGTNVGIGVLLPATLLHTLLADSGTNAVANVLTITHNTDGAVAAGFGAGVNFQLETTTTESTNAAKLEALWNTATHASRKGDLVASVADSGGWREGWRIRGSGTAPMIGFYGVTPVVRPTAYTQTYATASRTHSNPTATTVTVSVTQTTPWGYSAKAEAEAIVTAINALITDVANVKQVLNQAIDDLQANGLLQ